MRFAERIKLDGNILCAVDAKNAYGLVVQDKTIRIIVDNDNVVSAPEID